MKLMIFVLIVVMPIFNAFAQIFVNSQYMDARACSAILGGELVDLAGSRRPRSIGDVAASISPDGQYFAEAINNREIIIRRIGGRRLTTAYRIPLSRRDHENEIRGLMFNPAASLLAIKRYSGRVDLYVHRGVEWERISLPQIFSNLEFVHQIAFSADGRFFAVSHGRHDANSEPQQVVICRVDSLLGPNSRSAPTSVIQVPDANIGFDLPGRHLIVGAQTLISRTRPTRLLVYDVESLAVPIRELDVESLRRASGSIHIMFTETAIVRDVPSLFIAVYNTPKHLATDGRLIPFQDRVPIPTLYLWRYLTNESPQPVFYWDLLPSLEFIFPTSVAFYREQLFVGDNHGRIRRVSLDNPTEPSAPQVFVEDGPGGVQGMLLNEQEDRAVLIYGNGYFHRRSLRDFLARFR